MIVVGPEGGLAADERNALEVLGAVFGSVSPYRLRSETAAAALTAVVMCDLRGGGTGTTDSIDSSDGNHLD
jgi:16S rRNA U1498 N3-methylase RsmE